MNDHDVVLRFNYTDDWGSPIFLNKPPYKSQQQEMEVVPRVIIHSNGIFHCRASSLTGTIRTFTSSPCICLQRFQFWHKAWKVCRDQRGSRRVSNSPWITCFIADFWWFSDDFLMVFDRYVTMNLLKTTVNLANMTIPGFTKQCEKMRKEITNAGLSWYVPVVPHKAVAEVSKIGNL